MANIEVITQINDLLDANDVTIAKTALGVLGAATKGDASIVAADLATGAVTNAKILDGAVTAGKIATSAVDLTTSTVTGTLPVVRGGTGTSSPAIVAGTNVTVSGTWPNQTINAASGGTPADGSITTAKLADGAVTAAKVTDAAFTVAKTSGLQTALDGKASIDVQGEADLVNSQVFSSKKIGAWTTGGGGTAAPLRILTLGDSFSTGLTIGPQMARTGVIGLGAINRSGTVTDLTGQFTSVWTNGKGTRFAVGAQADWTVGGSTIGDIRGDMAMVAYIKKPGGGSFALQYSPNQTNTWTTLATIDTSNASTIGAVNTYALPASLFPYYRLRITAVTAAVDIVFTGIYNANGGGVIDMPVCNGVGNQVTESITCPSDIFTPIWTALAPDVVLSRWLDPKEAWDSGGAFRTFYTSATAAFASTDWIQIGPHPIDTTLSTNTPPDTPLLSELNSSQRAWAVSTSQTFINSFNIFKSYSVANARGLMQDDKHLNALGNVALNNHLWSIVPLGHVPLGALLLSTSGNKAITTSGSSNIDAVPIEFTRPAAFAKAVQIYTQSEPMLSGSAWTFQSSTGELNMGRPGVPAIVLGVGGDNGAFPGQDGLKLGRTTKRWRGWFTGVSASIVTKTAAYTLMADDHTVLCDATSGSFAILLSGGAFTDRKYVIKRKASDVSSNTVTLTGTIDGVVNPVLISGQVMRLQYDGTLWYSL